MGQHRPNFTSRFKKIVINLKVQLMETIRKFIINVAFGALVLAFILFWVCAGIGIQSISIISAFLVFVSAAVLLAASPVSRGGMKRGLME